MSLNLHTHMILYLFISCKPLLDNCYQRIVDMMEKLNNEHFIIVVGGFEHTEFNEKDHILKLNCNDYYEGLPEKVIKTYDFISQHERFDMYTHFCKLDDDMDISRFIPLETITDYCGDVCNVTEGDRGYHMNRCSKNSKFNKTEYLGEYVPWCLGGSGYLLSRKSLSILSNGKNYYNEIYEDVYVAKLLERKNIYPQIYPNLVEFVSSMRPNGSIWYIDREGPRIRVI